MKIHPNALAAKVAAVNNANAYADQLFDALTKALSPLVGAKILKVNGTLLESVKKVMPTLPNTVALSVYRNSSGYSLCYVVKTCESYPLGGNFGQGCVYHETNVYLGELVGQTLNKLYDKATHGVFRSDFTEAEVLGYRKELERAKQAVSDANSKLFYFGEHDR